MTLKQQMRPHSEVVDTELEGQETVLLHLDRKLYYSLNSTGTRIWKGLKLGFTLQTISEQLQDEFVVEAEQANGSVLALVEDLQRQDLVVPVDPDTLAESGHVTL